MKSSVLGVGTRTGCSEEVDVRYHVHASACVTPVHVVLVLDANR